MLAYVNLVQKREKELGCDVLTHQKWSGAGYIDGILGSIQSGSSGSKSMGEGNTEAGEYKCLDVIEILWTDSFRRVLDVDECCNNIPRFCSFAF
jgi:hypothetical protein